MFTMFKKLYLLFLMSSECLCYKTMFLNDFSDLCLFWWYFKGKIALLLKHKQLFHMLLADDLKMASPVEVDCLQKLKDKFCYVKLGGNGFCHIFDTCSTSDYIRVAYMHPSTGRRTTVSVGRAAVMLKEGTVFLSKDCEASHLCHNKACVLASHISFEPHSVNNSRKTCVNEGMCIGHTVYPDCLVHLKMW